MAVFSIKPLPPFRLDLTVWVLRRLVINQTDRWDGSTYRRVMVIDEMPVEVEVAQSGSPFKPQLTVTTQGARMSARRREMVRSNIEKMLGLKVDLTPLYQLAEEDAKLAGLIEPFLGFRPPRLASVFETLLNGIACQQISMTAGMHLLNRLCLEYGLPLGAHRAFPRPVDLISTSPARLRQIGFSERKGQTILNIARAIVEKELDLEGLCGMESSQAFDQLMQIKGIGRWTAQYILLRGMGRLDVFPGDDVGGQNKMQRWLGHAERPDYDGIYKILAPWRPMGGLLYFYLLLDQQRRQGLLTP